MAQSIPPDQQQLSPDGRYRWNGTSWVPTASMVPTPSYPSVPVSYHMPPTPYQAQVAAKNPGVALLVSFFLPGVGSMMNGDGGKGAIILIGYLVSWVLTLVIIGIFGVIGFWLWGMIDAYTGAQAWNRRHGIIS